MSQKYDDTRPGSIHAQMNSMTSRERENQLVAGWVDRINSSFQPYHPITVFRNSFYEAFGEKPKTLWVPEQSGDIPRFAVQHMIHDIRTAFLVLNGLTKYSVDVNQDQKNDDLKVRERIHHLMVTRGPESSDHIPILDALENTRFVPGRRWDTNILDQDPEYLRITQLVANQEGKYALHFAPKSDEDAESNVELESGVFQLSTTGSLLESSAHSLAKLCEKDIASYRQWSEIPKVVRQQLLNFNSFAAVILTMRFMGFQQNQLIGDEVAGQRHTFNNSVLNHSDVSAVFGKFDERKRTAIGMFVRRVFNYQDDRLWSSQGHSRMYPIIGWPSLAGLAQEEILLLAEELDETDLLIPSASDEDQMSAGQKKPDWLGPVEYHRLVKYQATYATLMNSLKSDPNAWGDITDDELWCRHHIGEKWTDQRIKHKLDLFPFSNFLLGLNNLTQRIEYPDATKISTT